MKAAGLGDLSGSMHDTGLSNRMDTERAEETDSRVSLKQQGVELLSCTYCALVFHIMKLHCIISITAN